MHDTYNYFYIVMAGVWAAFIVVRYISSNELIVS